jgi:YggT family protein
MPRPDIQELTSGAKESSFPEEVGVPASGYVKIPWRNGCDMFILSNFLLAVASILDIILNLYMWVIIARALLSWVNPDPYNTIVRILYNITEPVLYAVRKRIPVFFGGIDFAPMVVLLAIMFLRSFLVASLRELAVRM